VVKGHCRNNMQCLLRMFVPAHVQIGVGEPLQSLLTVRPEHVLYDTSQDSYLLVRKRRMVQVGMKALGMHGVPYPIPGVKQNTPPIKSDFSTLQFSAEDVGTTSGNRKVFLGVNPKLFFQLSCWPSVSSQPNIHVFRMFLAAFLGLLCMCRLANGNAVLPSISTSKCELALCALPALHHYSERVPHPTTWATLWVFLNIFQLEIDQANLYMRSAHRWKTISIATNATFPDFHKLRQYASSITC